jgi:hypothetical protein
VGEIRVHHTGWVIRKRAHASLETPGREFRPSNYPKPAYTAILAAAIMGSNQSKQSNRRSRSSLNFQWSSEEAELIDLLFYNLFHVDVLHKSNSGFC